MVENAEVNCGDGIDHDCAGGDVECGGDFVDGDGDGFPVEVDCDDTDPLVNPGAPEMANNGVDDDCDPATLDECFNDFFDEFLGNDSWDEALAVDDANDGAGVQYGDLVVCHGDDDWYSIELAPGDGLEVDVYFTHVDGGDLDVELYRLEGGEPVVVAASRSIDDNETVYLRESSEGGQYFVRVYGYSNATNVYGMTVNVFEGCIDGALWEGEHNDVAAEAQPLGIWRPFFGQICDHDDDWFEVSLEEAGDLQVVLHFVHGEGDLDVQVLRGDERLGIANSSNDNELLQLPGLAAGTYLVRVYGYQGATNAYRLLVADGAEAGSIRKDEHPGLDIPDRDGETDGRLVYRMALNAPAGAIVTGVTVRDLDINHSFLRDLRVSLEMGDAEAVLWDRQGDWDGGDGGLDDDWVWGTGGDINFDNRSYREFDLLPLANEMRLVILDQGPDDVGTLADLDIEINYLAP